MDVYLFVPTGFAPPFQPIIYFPGIDPFVPNIAKSSQIQPGMAAMPLDYVVKSGRVLVQPVYKGSYDRCCILGSDRYDFGSERYADGARKWPGEVGRVLDYLESRSDYFDINRIGFIGVSIGASYALPILALEPRFQAAVLLSGGLPQVSVRADVDPLNYVSRIKLPVLMVNGQFDLILRKDAYQDPLFRLLGTPTSLKRQVVLDAGHGYLPRNRVLNETLAWLDKHLGKVGARSRE